MIHHVTHKSGHKHVHGPRHKQLLYQAGAGPRAATDPDKGRRCVPGYDSHHLQGHHVNAQNTFNMDTVAPGPCLSFTAGDITTWAVGDVDAYVTTRSTSSDCSVGLANRLAEVRAFLRSKVVDGVMLTWLVSPPFEKPPKTQHAHVAGKLKRLDPRLWKGVRWKDFLEPIVVLHCAPPGARMVLRPGARMVLTAPADSMPTTAPGAGLNRVYSMTMYDA